MKKVALSFIVAMLLVMSSVVAYAAQPAEVTLTDEEAISVHATRIWKDVWKTYNAGQTVTPTIMYNAGGYTGILYYMYGYHDGNYYHALYSGWIYTGEVQPFSHVRY